MKFSLTVYLLIIAVSISFAQPNQLIDLQKMIDDAQNGETILLKGGTYDAVPSEYIEELCGNCGEHQTTVHGTKGFVIKDKTIHIKGEDKEKVILHTNAGYGVLFINSQHSSISNVTIGGGVRDTSGDATNAGIVLKYSKVRIFDCIISNDTARSNKTPIVGVSGIILRENSEAIIRNNIIRNNTWDGVALYRGAVAYIMDNIIENGRGAGVGITWDAAAFVFRNRVSGFWKGIGTFGTSTAVVKNNAVFDNLGWGIVISGNSHMQLENNVITRNGNCGVAPWVDSLENGTGVITNNIITENGWRKEWVCPQVGYWMNANPSRFTFTYNNVWNNSAGEYRDISDMTGKYGNVSVDPLFKGQYDFTLQASSPLLNIGNPAISNLNGTQSHMGIDGGQSVK
ncbi:MAG: right-handed parallel beta-helix repeat-containing protein [Ignavibacteriae bacterium]|nr:MAG: right-handed parallel beta-helix repeat-containing protein [Ignavibacteriota bacterium]